jgi:hypothetical protein
MRDGGASREISLDAGFKPDEHRPHAARTPNADSLQ